MRRSFQLPSTFRISPKVLLSCACLYLRLLGFRKTWFSLLVTPCPSHMIVLIFGSKPAPIVLLLRCPVDRVPLQAHHERRGGARFFSSPAWARTHNIMAS